MLASSALAQEKEKITDDGNNELTINLAYFVFEIVELNYERILMEEFSVGLAANYWFEERPDIEYMIAPFFRFYPIDSRRRASAFFIEGNFSVVGGTEYEYFYSPFGSGIPREENYVRGGAGVAVGGKFLSKNNFVGEAYGGLGRIFGSDSWPEIYPRVGVTFGKRF